MHSDPDAANAARSASRAPRATQPNPRSSNPTQANRKRHKARRGYGWLLFVFIVVLPGSLVAYYYAAIASQQYESEMRFAVRGTNSSPFDMLGLSAIPGASSQTPDSYIVVDYLRSSQVLMDLETELGIDIREFYSHDDIDPVFRVDPEITYGEFLRYWGWMSDADFNSTTAIATFKVRAFSSEEAQAITNAILHVSSKLINDLSTDARTELIAFAQSEVSRTEKRLAAAREEVRRFRDREQFLDPVQQAQTNQELIAGIQKEMLDLNARRAVLAERVSPDSATVQALDRQIAALDAEFKAQMAQFGSGSGDDDGERNLSDVVNDYNRLIVEQEFAEKAYTSALSSLETSQAEARRQERYFAIIVKPTEPESALFPKRALNTALAIAVLMLSWLLAYLLIEAVRDHRT